MGKVIKNGITYLNCNAGSIPYYNYDYYTMDQQITDISNFTKLYSTTIPFGNTGSRVATALGITAESTITTNMSGGWDNANSCYYSSENQKGAYAGYDFGEEINVSKVKLWLGKYVNQNKILPVTFQYLDENSVWHDFQPILVTTILSYPINIFEITLNLKCYGVRWVHTEINKTSNNNITFFGMTIYENTGTPVQKCKPTEMSETVPMGYSGFGDLLVGTPKTYVKFNGQGIVLPWAINSDYKVEVVFYEYNYISNTAVIGNTNGSSNSHLTSYNNKYYTSSGSSEANFGTWSSGEHTFINNNGNSKNEFDGTEVTNYTPTNADYLYTIGNRGINSIVYYGYIKSYKIYSISNNTLLHDFRPYDLFGTGCFVDIIENKIYIVPNGQAVDSVT